MSGYRILIVDDSPDVHSVVGAYLKYSGYEVFHAANGAEGLDLMGAERPDLVLLDVQMPTLDGFGVLQQMKARRDLMEIPVMFLSSLDRPNLKVKGLQMGADDYIVKPFDRAELMARVTVGLRRGERFRRMERTFGGQLGPISVEELLQTMDLGDKNGRIDLPDMDAAIGVGGKMVVSARWLDFEGGAALQRIFLLEHGRFQVEFQAGIPEGGEPVGKIQDILLSAMVAIDEFKERLGGSLDLGSRVGPTGEKKKLGFQDDRRPDWPTTVADVIARMNGDLKDNLDALLEAVDDGVVVKID